ncbi:hypothetical protein RFI_34775 [Reticulomyxa filosa]|uniref:Uncharacterized protein n=1 Tax=Reticulomyxa filosa TaxID=46433 RepID=X6LNA6_RETFI|nr:hypothetical protein RFI_34775 [Reticulomyxa filosa]|eukprot:ETO02642.1 hypothetical protein RFI_34775 [Reticulomyxa filosa]
MDIETDEVLDSDRVERMAVDNDSDVEMSDEMQESQALLTNEDFEARLSRPDSVLDENFITIVKEYATLKCEVCCIMTREASFFFPTNPKEFFFFGNKDEFINYVKEGVLLAASNYKGYTKMCNLLVDWMKEFHHPKTIHVFLYFIFCFVYLIYI